MADLPLPLEMTAQTGEMWRGGPRPRMDDQGGV